MIPITGSLAIGDEEVRFRFLRSSGPGGQKVNKTSSAVQLRFDVRNSPSLPEEVRRRLSRLAGKRLTSRGVLLIEARRHRTQERNRRDALERLVLLIRKAAQRGRPRRSTRPPAASKRARLESKRRRGVLKELRQPVR
jgi:ribosome-associated protein